MCHQLLNVRLFAFLAAMLAIASPSVAAPISGGVDGNVVNDTPSALSIPDVLDRVRIAASGEEWRQQGWTDPAIEGWIANAIVTVHEAGHGQELPELPKFAGIKERIKAEDVARQIAVERAGAGSSLIVCKRLDSVRLANAVVLVDGDASISFADNCVIIARGAVHISHGSGNVVVAGQFVHVSHDGHERSRLAMSRRLAEERAVEAGQPIPAAPLAHAPVPPSSLLLSGGALEVSHAGGAVCGAAGTVDLGFAWDCVFLNSPVIRTSHKFGSVELKSDKVRLGVPAGPHPLAADLRLHSVAGEETVIFWHKDRRYIAKRDKPITDETGEAVAELNGWVVTVVASDLAVLSNEAERATVVLQPEKPQ